MGGNPEFELFFDTCCAPTTSGATTAAKAKASTTKKLATTSGAITTVKASTTKKLATKRSGGLRINSPNACIELGNDVKIKRVGDEKLGLDANVHIKGALSAKNLYVGDMS